MTIVVRPARIEDAAPVAACVCEAYIHYIERIGRQPGPMLDDYSEVIHNVAVHPSARGTGVGRALLELAEREALRQGYDSIYLATHVKMVENRNLYTKIGYVQYDERVINGFPRVFLRKSLRADAPLDAASPVS